jgi:O-succinylbenzoic acid--CoA ligase
LRSTADREGVILVATYGMSETCGGCVYDGRPLEGTRVALDDDGRVHLGGPSLASGYLADPERTDSHFVADTAGERWFRTDDHGEFLPDGRLQVHGRLDDLITTGGLKVSPRLVEETIVAHCPGVIEALVVAVPDPEWGQAVGAIVTTASGTRLTREDVREALRGILPGHALPQRVRTVPAIPTRGPGKPDRRGAADLLSDG